MDSITYAPIATVRTPFKEKFGIPRQSGLAEGVEGRIVFEPGFRSREALDGIEDFSHIWIIFDFSKAKRDSTSLKVRPPRLGGNKKVGVFATRSPFRPNGIGMSAVRLVRVEHTAEGDELVVAGVDMLDGTPVLDIKPYLPISDRVMDAKGGFSDDRASYRLQVKMDDALKAKLPQDVLGPLTDCLSQDPRPAYQEDGRIYGMTYQNVDVKFKVEGDALTVTDIVETDL